jgi:hypothetical protein
MKGIDMRPVNRWVIAILMAVVLVAVFVPLYYMGFFLGGMATDSCNSLPDAAFLWLEVGWPIVLLATALTAPVLIVRQARWRWVWISLVVGLAISACWYLSWFPLLSVMCK